MGLEVVAVPAFSDNYLWLVHDDDIGETAVIDPGDGEAVLVAARERGWTIGKVFNTHWHPDHTGGNDKVKAAGAEVFGPAAETARIPTIDQPLGEGDRVRLPLRNRVETLAHAALRAVDVDHGHVRVPARGVHDIGPYGGRRRVDQHLRMGDEVDANEGLLSHGMRP